ncbi:MAG: hypothetical protein ACK41Y_16260, partial [Paracoccus hibiscisoli]|uniref:hypothetical protein n=1 Tax=Paracoccus hibiscisoli TaxID=2023261 RepID=UPI00391BDE3F
QGAAADTRNTSCACLDPASPPQRLAVDMSIWLTQFIKAMRDDEGKLLPNAHLLGTFRRICRVGACVLPCAAGAPGC